MCFGIVCVLTSCGLSSPSLTNRCTRRNIQPSSESVWQRCLVADKNNNQQFEDRNECSL